MMTLCCIKTAVDRGQYFMGGRQGPKYTEGSLLEKKKKSMSAPLYYNKITFNFNTADVYNTSTI